MADFALHDLVRFVGWDNPTGSDVAFHKVYQGRLGKIVKLFDVPGHGQKAVVAYFEPGVHSFETFTRFLKHDDVDPFDGLV